MSGGRIEVTNFNAEVLLGIGETFRGVGSGVADLAVTSSIYHRGTVPVGEYLWAVPFFPVTTLEFYENIYQFMGIKGLARGLQAAQRRAPDLHDLGRVGRHGVDAPGRERPAGTVHSLASRSNSLYVAPSASPVRAAVKIVNSSARALMPSLSRRPATNALTLA